MYQITETAEGLFEVSFNGIVFATKTSREWAEREIIEAAERIRRDEEYRASPVYADWLKSLRPTEAEVDEAIRHHMHDQGDLA